MYLDIRKAPDVNAERTGESLVFGRSLAMLSGLELEQPPELMAKIAGDYSCWTIKKAQWKGYRNWK